MADAEKVVADNDPATEKGWAKDVTTDKTESPKKKRAYHRRKKTAPAEAAKPESLEDVLGDKEKADEFLKSVREQIDACKDEIAFSLKQSVTAEFKTIVVQEVARANRRRRWNNFFHDIVIIALALVAVYFEYCLYDVHYFSFMKTECEKNGTCETADDKKQESSAGPVKDATWYLANYSYLFDNIQTRLSADNLSAYYLYTDDRKVSEMAPEYLLGMAYNQVDVAPSTDSEPVEISEEAMKQAFEETFGSLNYYVASDFAHGCWNFVYSKSEHNFLGTKTDCSKQSKREIVEKIERIYEEGEVIYVVTVAAVHDKTTANLYNFDSLFRPIALNSNADELGLYSAGTNRYQYQFKKTNDKYYFSSIVKLK